MKAYTRQSKLWSREPECEKAAARESILDRIPIYDAMAGRDYELFSLYGRTSKSEEDWSATDCHILAEYGLQ